MKTIKLLLTIIATSLLFAACGRCHYNEATEVYEEGLLLNDDLVAVRTSDGKLSIKNTITGKVTIRDIDLDWSTPSPNDSLAVFCSSNKRGYYNMYTGEIIVPAQYRRAWVFKDGLAAVQKNGNIGFIDHHGNVVIDFQFPYHGNPLSSFVFEDGHCVVANNQGKCGVIDKEGQWLIQPEYDYVCVYKEYAIVARDGVTIQMGYDGEIINSFVLDNLKELTFEEEVSYETRDGKIEHSKRTVSTGLFAYCIGGRYGLMDGGTLTRLTEPLFKNIHAASRTMFTAYLLDYNSQIILNNKGEIMK